MTAVCLGGPPSADLGRRRLFEPEGVLIDSQSSNHARPALRLRTDGCASCASAVFAFATAHIATRSSHRARPTALVPPRSSLRAHRTTCQCCVDCVRPRPCSSELSVMHSARARLSLPQSYLLFSFKSSDFLLLPPDLERGGLRSPIGHCDS